MWGPLREAGLLDSQESTTQPTAHGQEVAVGVSTRYEAGLLYSQESTTQPTAHGQEVGVAVFHQV